MNDKSLHLTIGTAILGVALAVWGYTAYIKPRPQPRPTPVWFGIDKTVSQLADGRLLSVKVNLQLDQGDDLKGLSEYEPALRMLLQTLGSERDRNQLSGTEALEDFSYDIRDEINDYLKDLGRHERVRGVFFEEVTLLP